MHKQANVLGLHAYTSLHRSGLGPRAEFSPEGCPFTHLPASPEAARFHCRMDEGLEADGRVSGPKPCYSPRGGPHPLAERNGPARHPIFLRLRIQPTTEQGLKGG